ncbi:unnamed protein product [Caenorhabditis angaria]|uniref:Protein kinase domain-containing protein n=1 Tax=Caenorhabditis angaria TaxID=860376 RepID=A0A9P1I991_9PELO|nr:unnamed protein product [Caenorhabditis angaria]
MSSSSSCAKPEFQSGQDVSGYTIVGKLGSGGFGAVYHVKKDALQAALKTEFVVKESSQTLKNEVHILRLMQWSPHFCRLYAAKRLTWQDQKVNIMVMSLCGRPLSRLRRMMPQRHFTRETAARLSFMILKALHDLHQSGILHRDVKASNCGWHEPTRQIMLFDLGFCRKFLDKDPKTGKLKHREARKSAGFIGTSKFCSVYAHDEKDQGRRDDLWAWLYTTAEFFLGSLPWSNEDNSHLVSTQKHKISNKLFLRCPREIYTIFNHVKQLKFDSCPDYPMMLKEFQNMLTRLQIFDEEVFDFEPGSAYYEQYYANRQTDSECEDCQMLTTDLETSASTGEQTKASRIVDVDPAPALNEVVGAGAGAGAQEAVITLNSSKSSEKDGGVQRLAAGLNRAFNRIIGNE